MTEFDDIRPYYDHEVRPTLNRLLADPELAEAVTQLKFPRLNRWLGWLLRPLIGRALTRQMAGIDSVFGFQQVVERYMANMVATTSTGFTTSGLEQLDPQQAYLFVSNHRDIAMDPAFVNLGLYYNGCNTLRIAIGDNLLTKPFVSDLMRLNKSFIVNRSAKAPREKLKAAKHLSAYIHHSIVNEQHNIWIAQREGRAKDGCDKTNSAVVGMFTLNRPKTMDFAEYINSLNIVPVSISYEYDPCDSAKARELFHQRTTGGYQKEEHEDVKSIAKGIAGQKGHVHVAFGSVLRDLANNDAVVEEIDRQILQNYVLHASNCFAYQLLNGRLPEVTYSDKKIPFVAENLAEQRQVFDLRMMAIPSEYRDIVLAMYANPVVSKLTQNSLNDE
jgi:hypothetical protein